MLPVDTLRKVTQCIGTLCGVILISTCGSSTQCETISGTQWVPSVPSASASNHNSGITVTSSTQTSAVPIIGMGQAAPSSVEVSFTIDMTQDLGALGSITLVAKTKDYPSSLSGGAFPMLVSLHDGTNEYINLARSGSGGDCAQSGYFTCSGGSCSANSACTISYPSAYASRTHWEQHQAPNVSAEDSPSTNTFPTCNWSGGTNGSATRPSCAFNSTFFPGAYSPARLRYGVSYTAKYVLVADSYSTVTSKTASIELTVYKRQTPASAAASAGAVDLNIFLVGDTNVQASRTAIGQRNLNTLVNSVGDYYNQAGAEVKLGSVNAVEWACATGGESYSALNVSSLGTMLKDGSALAPSGTEGKAVNVFLVSTITDDTDSTASGFTILGFDGAIGAPPINSTAISGLTVATFDNLDSFNPACPSEDSLCAANEQDADFQELGIVVGHEIGHFFGLNHLSESTGDSHDGITDTPICQLPGGYSYISLNVCLNHDTSVYPETGQTCNASCSGYNSSTGTFCPTNAACSFNHLMWWTTKNFHEASGAGDGNLITADTGVVLNYSPFVQ